MRKRKIHGARMNKDSSVAYPLSMIFRLPLKTQRNSPLAIRKTIMTTNPERELRNEVISFLNREYIGGGGFGAVSKVYLNENHYFMFQFRNLIFSQISFILLKNYTTSTFKYTFDTAPKLIIKIFKTSLLFIINIHVLFPI
jgi:hypothetical protein